MITCSDVMKKKPFYQSDKTRIILKSVFVEKWRVGQGTYTWSTKISRTKPILIHQLSALMSIFSYTIFPWATRRCRVAASQFLSWDPWLVLLSVWICTCVHVSVWVSFGFPKTCQWTGKSKTVIPFSHSECISASCPGIPGIFSRFNATLKCLFIKVVNQPRRISNGSIWSTSSSPYRFHPSYNTASKTRRLCQ